MVGDAFAGVPLPAGTVGVARGLALVSAASEADSGGALPAGAETAAGGGLGGCVADGALAVAPGDRDADLCACSTAGDGDCGDDEAALGVGGGAGGAGAAGVAGCAGDADGDAALDRD
ncbi:MAG: hypothetical protein P8124_01110 [Gammaproteobacteria bacterium]